MSAFEICGLVVGVIDAVLCVGLFGAVRQGFLEHHVPGVDTDLHGVEAGQIDLRGGKRSAHACRQHRYRERKKARPHAPAFGA